MAKALPKEERERLMNFIVMQKEDDLVFQMLGVAGAIYGPLVGRSLMAFFSSLRAGGAAMEVEAVVLDAAALETVELASVEALEAAEMISLGGRFLAMTGVGLAVFAAGIAIAIAIEVALNLWKKDEYIRAEHEAAIARLQCRYQLRMFEALRHFKEDLSRLHNWYRILDRIGDVEGLQKRCDEEGRKFADSIIERFKSVTYEQAWEDVHKEDLDSGPVYDLDEMGKEELIERTKEAVHEAAEKAKEEKVMALAAAEKRE
ncbi:uncharacterized protein TRUGW13939_11247 [Talaromyces rugulosus]|uniref:Uncharacterized protein n=1 Tax=Talaromyces rugulosus TaxID=121627 RepID=A0A7H8RCF5_TALRU|nr:uncharacterized protein TRUGW13939_11247 [Talaromyces rugulosus]QKX64074.1 hypothetical protein TRUGW13939_11247 [Talaromyces rugulosus]